MFLTVAGPALSVLLAAAPLTVRFDVTSLAADDFTSLDGVALEKSATVRLVQEGFAVVGAGLRADVGVTLRAQTSPRRLVLTGRRGDEVREVSVDWEPATLAETHLELVQQLVELVRALPEPPPPAPEPTPAPGATFGASLAVGALWRSAVDPWGVVGLDYGQRLRGVVEVGLSGTRGSSISVVEGQLAAGVGLQLVREGRFTLDVRALVGAWLHAWRVDLPAATAPTGARVDPLLDLAVTPSVEVGAGWRLGLRLGAGWSRARTHLADAAVLWSRDDVRLEVAATVSGWP